MCAAAIVSGRAIPVVSQAEWRANDEAFKAKFAEALKKGFFYLQIPEETGNVQLLTDFANHFHQNDALKQFKGTHSTGYADRKADGQQIESLYLEREFWDAQAGGGPILSDEVKAIAEKARLLAIEILGRALESCGVPQHLWDQITGGLMESEEGGQTHLTFNHYRRGPQEIGVTAHRDTGCVTVLQAGGPGLQVFLDDEWIDVDPQEGYWIINFGRSLQTSLNSEKLSAALHQVKPVDNDRVSIGIFIDDGRDTPFVKWDGENGVIETGLSYAQYMDRCTEDYFPVTESGLAERTSPQ